MRPTGAASASGFAYAERHPDADWATPRHAAGARSRGPGEARAANRDGLLDPSMRMKFIGFRLVRTLGRP
jgi:hypothetical protein